MLACAVFYVGISDVYLDNGNLISKIKSCQNGNIHIIIQSGFKKLNLLQTTL